MKEFDGAPRGIGSAMAVARKLDVDEAVVLVVGEDAEDGDEFEFAFAEHEVLVFAIPDVFNMDVANEVGEFPIHLPEGLGFSAEAVANIERETEPGAGDVFFENLKFGHVVHEHTGFWFEGELDATAFGMLGELEATGDEPIPGFLFGDFRFDGAGPEADTLGVEFRGDVNGATEKFEADLPAFAADERGMMFAGGIKKVAGTGFDDDAELEFVEKLAESGEVGGFGGERVAVVIVESERDAPVAAVGHDFEGFLKPVVGKAVGVVAEVKIHVALGRKIAGF